MIDQHFIQCGRFYNVHIGVVMSYLFKTLQKHCLSSDVDYYRASDRVRKNLRNYTAFHGEFCGKKGHLWGRLCSFYNLI